jgi:hypothetical protein
MKRTIHVALGVTLLAANFTLIAAAQTNGKDNYLLYGRNHENPVYSLPEKISKLEAEIAKGENVYTHDERQVLGKMLKEAKENLRGLEKPGR